MQDNGTLLPSALFQCNAQEQSVYSCLPLSVAAVDYSCWLTDSIVCGTHCEWDDPGLVLAELKVK